MHLIQHCGLEVITPRKLQHNQQIKNTPGKAEEEEEEDIPQLLHHVLQEQQPHWSEPQT